MKIRTRAVGVVDVVAVQVAIGVDVEAVSVVVEVGRRQGHAKNSKGTQFYTTQS